MPMPTAAVPPEPGQLRMMRDDEMRPIPYVVLGLTGPEPHGLYPSERWLCLCDGELSAWYRFPCGKDDLRHSIDVDELLSGPRS